MARSEQAIDDKRPDEAGASRDQDVHAAADVAHSVTVGNARPVRDSEWR
jgi:hypothetical protein